MNALEKLSAARLIATGSPLLIDAPDLHPQCTTDAEFDVLVTAYYKFLYEELSRDISSLKTHKGMPRVKKARYLLYVLRTAAQHSGNENVVREAQVWRRREHSPQSAAVSLASKMREALDELASVATWVSQDQSRAARWRDDLAVDTRTIFAQVVSDLGLHFTPNNQSRMIRLVEKRLEIQPPRTDPYTGTADYCVQEILSTRTPLPVPYSDVLDSFGLFGKPQAMGVLLLAYSVAEVAPSLSGDAFLDRVEKMFQIATTP